MGIWPLPLTRASQPACPPVLSSLLLCAWATLSGAAQATSFYLSLDDSLVQQEVDPNFRGPISSGLDLALRNRLFNVAVDYDFQVNMGAATNLPADRNRATEDDTAQRLGASLNSKLLNELLHGKVRVKADSMRHSTTGAYNYRFTPTYSRKVAELATLDVNYQYLLQRPSSEAIPQAQHGYSLGLKGSLNAGRLRWSGRYSSIDIYQDSAAHILSSESFQLRSDYRLLPDMLLRLNSTVTERTNIGKNFDASVIQTEYGAGLQWKPSANYALDFAVSQMAFSNSDDEILLRRGSLSWFPRHDMQLSLNYGDTLVEGTPGVLFNTRLEIDRF